MTFDELAFLSILVISAFAVELYMLDAILTKLKKALGEES